MGYRDLAPTTEHNCSFETFGAFFSERLWSLFFLLARRLALPMRYGSQCLRMDTGVIELIVVRCLSPGGILILGNRR